MIRNCLVFFSLVIFISCGSKNKMPPGILKADKMQAVLWDVIKADAFTKGFLKMDSSKNAIHENLKLQEEIFAIHHISKQDFYTSYDYYKSNPGQLKVMIDSIIANGGRDKAKAFKTTLQTE